MSRSNNQKGQLLIESAVALTIVSIALTGLFTLLNNGLRYSSRIADRYTAANLAAEGIEIVKNIIDTNVLLRDAGFPIAYFQGLDETNTGEYYEADFNDIAMPAGRAIPTLGSKKTGTPTPLRQADIFVVFLYDATFTGVDPNCNGNICTLQTENTKPTKFTRKIEIDHPTWRPSQGFVVNDSIHVKSTVEWTNAGGQSESIFVEATYFDWTK
ncbi:MAG: hypothetical protein COU08_03835 [Candidatus Harrisonbacteria bacterium CG10_big_fil_rev_8_21_14_0_10_42_17]|uniref:Type II secretion system protein n=1 Tax=Candidatus Harrisonbacteria bacterium CG10_big_fil_rev_8_21_14_0_10_42_17 TaxID=1974584 RepID=A0A2M6WHC2_9BACT|nr:MAG: hypothetical protein COU08_03835 [Candidatus Harrisonbacteria bacterium CG10_big_fil_rev_8_21_14_0_10_42_17]